jgi:hypothetical protein
LHRPPERVATETGSKPIGPFNPPEAALEAPSLSFPSGANLAGSSTRWVSEVRARNQENQSSNHWKPLAPQPGKGVSPSMKVADGGEPGEQPGWNILSTPGQTGNQPRLKPRLLASLLPEQGVELPLPPAQGANAIAPSAKPPDTAVREAGSTEAAHLRADSVGTLRAPLTVGGFNPVSPRLGQVAKPEQAIQINIGRIEIRATQPTARKEKAKPSSPPLMSLDEYLRQRSGGDRQP